MSLVLKENTLALAKSVLHHIPYGKAVTVASILTVKFPTTDTTKKFYESGKPRWSRSFAFSLNPFCPLSKLFALTGLYQPEMTETLLKNPHKGTFVDIGANFGYFSVLWLSKWNGDALAIEPIRQNFELLTENVRSFGLRAKTAMCCLGDHEGEVTMSYDLQYPMLAKIGDHPGESQTIKMRHLVKVLETERVASIDVLKCDAEGYDIKILNSAREIFEKRRVQTLFFEPETLEGKRDSELEDFTRFLLANGYQAASTSFDLCFCLPPIATCP
jgi:FkbM family methyltransferase